MYNRKLKQGSISGRTCYQNSNRELHRAICLLTGGNIFGIAVIIL